MSFPNDIERVMSGDARGIAPSALRATLAAAEPFYAAAAAWRNRRFDRNPERALRLPRPVISIGNITTGGTGKTPVVRWLASRLRDDGRCVGILSRGYKATGNPWGDEQRMLDRLLNLPGCPPVVIRAGPDRFALGEAALRDEPNLDLFLLDDGFQHRRLARDLDIVLIDATQPFGHNHVLPRGLLREPMVGLSRASAFVLTHATSVAEGAHGRIERELRRWNPGAPIYRAVHAPIGFRTAASESAGGPNRSLDALRAHRAFAFSGLGNPAGFEGAVRGLCGTYAGHRRFADHHAYAPRDLAGVRRAARDAGADVLVTTEKDWVKLAPLAGADASELPIWRLDIAAQFVGEHEDALLHLVRGTAQCRNEHGATPAGTREG